LENIFLKNWHAKKNVLYSFHGYYLLSKFNLLRNENKCGIAFGFKQGLKREVDIGIHIVYCLFRPTLKYKYNIEE